MCTLIFIRVCSDSSVCLMSKGVRKQRYLAYLTAQQLLSQRLSIEMPVAFFTAGTEGDQNGLDHPSVEVSLDENSGMLVDGFERTFDGKLKCRYCNYASKGTARLIEHIRIHTGMKYSTVLHSEALWCVLSVTFCI